MHSELRSYLALHASRREFEAELTYLRRAGLANSRRAVLIEEERIKLAKEERESLGRLRDYLSPLDANTKVWLHAVLANDKTSSDDELEKGLLTSGITRDQAKICVALRAWFLTDLHAQF